MKSKTSCFNRTIFKKNLTHYWPLWAAYLLFLLLCAPFNIWQMATAEWSYYDEATRMWDIMYSVVNTLIRPLPTFVFAVAMALAVFSYLYSAKNANMMHALPVNRLELYVTNYLSGLSFLIIPQILTFFVSVLVCMANQITCIQYLFFALLCQLGLSFFAYSMAVFVAMFTGQVLAMPVYYFVLNYLYVGCTYIVNSVKELLSYGLTNTWNPGKACILSPLYYLNNNLRAILVYEEESNIIAGLEIKGMYLLAIYAVAAVVIAIIAYQVYRRRQIETAGDWISVGVVKPLFRWGVGLCGGILLALAITSMLSDSRQLNVYLCTVAGFVLTGFICFFGAEMLLRKNFKVFCKKRVIEWAGFTVIAVAFVTLFEVDAFGIERALPKEEEVETAFINMDYPVPVWVKSEDISKVLELHQEAIMHKKEYQAFEQEGSGYYYTTFRYYLKDGSMFERRYPIPVTAEYLMDETSAVAEILGWERETLKSRILGLNYDTNQYISGYIDLYDDNRECRNYMFSESELAAIVKAIEKDIDMGNFDSYYLNSINGDKEYYYNNISLDFYNREGYRDIWDYYYYYDQYGDDMENTLDHEMARQGNCYIQFGPQCEYTIQALEDLGITDDTWKLRTSAEMAER